MTEYDLDSAKCDLQHWKISKNTKKTMIHDNCDVDLAKRHHNLTYKLKNSRSNAAEFALDCSSWKLLWWVRNDVNFGWRSEKTLNYSDGLQSRLLSCTMFQNDAKLRPNIHDDAKLPLGESESSQNYDEMSEIDKTTVKQLVWTYHLNDSGQNGSSDLKWADFDYGNDDWAGIGLKNSVACLDDPATTLLSCVNLEWL